MIPCDGVHALCIKVCVHGYTSKNMADLFLTELEHHVALEGVYLPSDYKQYIVQVAREQYIPWDKEKAQRFGKVLKQLKQMQSFSLVPEVSFDVLVQDLIATDVGVFRNMIQHPCTLRVHMIASGNFFTLLLMQDQRIFGFGKSYYGELGMKGDTCMAHILSDVPPASFIAAGHSSAYAIADNGKLYAWGCKADGRLGVSADVTALAYAEEGRIFASESSVQFRKISAGSTHAAGLSTSHYLYTWGMGQYNGFRRIKYLPKKLMEGKCMDVVCGVSGYHSVCIMADGQVWGWGHNNAFALGLPERKLYVKPHRLPFRPFEVDQIAAGWAHTVVHLTKGGFLVVGRNDDGQCNRSISDSTVLDSMEDMGKSLPAIPEYSEVHGVPLHGRIVCGSSSTAIVTDEGSWTFGSNYAGHLFRTCSTVWDYHAVFGTPRVLVMGYKVGYAI